MCLNLGTCAAIPFFLLFVRTAYIVYSLSLIVSYIIVRMHINHSFFYEMFCDTCMFIEHSLVPKEILHSGLIIIVPV